MTSFTEKVEKVVVINKQGLRTVMPDLWTAQSYAKDSWKGKVAKIEVTTIYTVEENE
jgi:hypothetical protein